MYGSAASGLVKELRRADTSLPRYRQDAVRAISREVRHLHLEVEASLDAYSQSAGSQAILYKIQILDLTIKHNVRCLVAYHLRRLALLSGQPPPASHQQAQLLSAGEEDFLARHRALLRKTQRSICPHLNWSVDADNPPDSNLFVLVKVVKPGLDEVMTEGGPLSLACGSIVHVCRSDIHELLRLGYVAPL